VHRSASGLQLRRARQNLPTSSVTSATEVSRRNTAVTLNYCRAALHRIRRAPSKNVLVEEQQRILNNLDLNQIDDPEVITLYRSILDEIGQVEISDRERKVIGEQFTAASSAKWGQTFLSLEHRRRRDSWVR
jgi:hypothetical protein